MIFGTTAFHSFKCKMKILFKKNLVICSCCSHNMRLVLKLTLTSQVYKNVKSFQLTLVNRCNTS